MCGNSWKHPQAIGMVSRHPVNVRVNAGKITGHVGNPQFIPKTSRDHLWMLERSQDMLEIPRSPPKRLGITCVHPRKQWKTCDGPASNLERMGCSMDVDDHVDVSKCVCNTHTHTHTHIYIHTHMYLCINSDTHTHTHTHTYIHPYGPKHITKHACCYMFRSQGERQFRVLVTHACFHPGVFYKYSIWGIHYLTPPDCWSTIKIIWNQKPRLVSCIFSRPLSPCSYLSWFVL